MSFLGSLMLGMFVLSAGGAIGFSGYNAGTESDKLKQAIKDTKNQTDAMQKKWDSIISQQVTLDDKIKDQILDNIDNLEKIKDRIIISRDAFQKQFRNIQIIGIIFIIIIFFLLQLKQFGIF